MLLKKCGEISPKKKHNYLFSPWNDIIVDVSTVTLTTLLGTITTFPRYCSLWSVKFCHGFVKVLSLKSALEVDGIFKLCSTSIGCIGTSPSRGQGEFSTPWWTPNVLIRKGRVQVVRSKQSPERPNSSSRCPSEGKLHQQKTIWCLSK